MNFKQLLVFIRPSIPENPKIRYIQTGFSKRIFYGIFFLTRKKVLWPINKEKRSGIVFVCSVLFCALYASDCMLMCKKKIIKNLSIFFLSRILKLKFIFIIHSKCFRISKDTTMLRRWFAMYKRCNKSCYFTISYRWDENRTL